MDDNQLRAFLASGSEKPAIIAARAQRIATILAVLLFVLWLVMTYGNVLASSAGATWWAFVVTVLLALALRFLTIYLDRRALRQDMRFFEEKRP